MRIICKRPTDQNGGKPGVAAYDLIGFRHHPTDTNPSIVCTLADGSRLRVTCPGQDSDGLLDRVVEALLSPGGVADCRKASRLRIEPLAPLVQRVYIENKWAQTCTSQYYGDPEHPCLVVSAITS